MVYLTRRQALATALTSPALFVAETVFGIVPSAAAAPAIRPAERERFIAALVGPARRSQAQTGVPASVTIAQAIIETGWGTSTLAVQGKNYFGIKAAKGPGPAGVIVVDTHEFIAGRYVARRLAFRKYHAPEESVLDHGLFLREDRRYAPALAASRDPRAFARAMARAGYATAPNYAAMVIARMDAYNLYRFDHLSP